MDCAILLRIARILALTLFGAAVVQGKYGSTEVWVSSVLDEAAMEQNGARPWTYSTNSAMHCLAISQALEGGQASCFTEDRRGAQCRTWDAEALIKVAATWDGTVGTTSCKIRKSFVRCYLNDDSSIGVNETYTVDCDKAYRCTEHGIEPINRLESCSEPFQDTSAGCLYIEPTLMDWCSARQRCKTLGGDLYSADTAGEFDKLRSYILNLETDLTDLWVAVKKISGRWQWLSNGRSPGLDFTGDWSSTDPNGIFDECARAVKYGDYKLGESACSDEHSAICQVVLN